MESPAELSHFVARAWALAAAAPQRGPRGPWRGARNDKMRQSPIKSMLALARIIVGAPARCARRVVAASLVSATSGAESLPEDCWRTGEPSSVYN